MIGQQTPAELDLHVIADNHSTHKHLKVTRWLKRHPRFHMHFIPTSSSWLNLIERWFREITDKRIRRSDFHSVPQLIEAIMAYIREHNQQPKAFQWTAKAEDIWKKSAGRGPCWIRWHQRETLHECRCDSTIHSSIDPTPS